MNVVSLFSGCGGLDLGFHNAGFNIIYANDNDKTVWKTFESNLNLTIDKRSITDINSNEIPDAIGIIGGPPCQSWSLAGSMKGTQDKRGQLFYEYVRVIKDKKPIFFVAENVPGIISKTHFPEFLKLISTFSKIGYSINFKQLNSRDYGVPQERKRVIIVGYANSLLEEFNFPSPTHTNNSNSNEKVNLPTWVTLQTAIGDLPESIPAQTKNIPNSDLAISNHEYMIGSFSTIYMSRNRRRTWNEQSFTIQAGGRHAPLHPESSGMRKIETDKWEFKGKTPFVRRLSIRECARIQTFPDDFIFYYNKVPEGYKMVGNAVPVKLSEAIAKKIYSDLSKQKQLILSNPNKST